MCQVFYSPTFFYISDKSKFICLKNVLFKLLNYYLIPSLPRGLEILIWHFDFFKKFVCIHVYRLRQDHHLPCSQCNSNRIQMYLHPWSESDQPFLINFILTCDSYTYFHFFLAKFHFQLAPICQSVYLRYKVSRGKCGAGLKFHGYCSSRIVSQNDTPRRNVIWD